MKIDLHDHYQSMSERLAPGIHEVNAQLGKYLIDNGYAVAVEDVPPEDETSDDVPPDDESEDVPPDGADGDRDEEDASGDDADYQAMTKGQLLNIAAAGGLELSERISKQAIIDALIAHGKQ